MKNKKHIDEIYKILLQQAEINRMHGNAIVELSDKPTCSMNDPEWRQCCCSCVHHLPTHIHCTTVVTRGKDDKCVCDIQTGWACCVDIIMASKSETPRIYTSWPEHGVGCELFEKRDNVRP